MSSNNPQIDALIALMARLPGLGPRSARRCVLHMIRKREVLMKPLADSLKAVASTVGECERCGNISVTTECDICLDPERQNNQICVVEDVADLWALERAMIYKGQYFVLGGVLSPLDGVGPDELNIPKLVRRVSEENMTEVILALNATVDGQTTAHYIAQECAGADVEISLLAQGVPVGGELDYLDDGTLSAALRSRKKY